MLGQHHAEHLRGVPVSLPYRIVLYLQYPSREEALPRSREGPSTLPRPLDPSRFAPQPAQQAPVQ